MEESNGKEDDLCVTSNQIKGNNGDHNGGIIVVSGEVIKGWGTGYLNNGKSQMYHTKFNQDEQSERHSKFVFSSLTNVIGGRVDGGRSHGAQSTRGTGGNVEQYGGADNGASNRNRSSDTINGGSKSVTERIDSNTATNSTCPGIGECKWSFGSDPKDTEPHTYFSFKLDSSRSSRVPKRMENRGSLHVKDVVRSNHLGSRNSTNGGNPSCNKNPKRSLEDWDAVQYQIGLGNGSANNLQDKVQSTDWNESSKNAGGCDGECQ